MENSNKIIKKLISRVTKKDDNNKDIILNVDQLICFRFELDIYDPERYFIVDDADLTVTADMLEYIETTNTPLKIRSYKIEDNYTLNIVTVGNKYAVGITIKLTEFNFKNIIRSGKINNILND